MKRLLGWGLACGGALWGCGDAKSNAADDDAGGRRDDAGMHDTPDAGPAPKGAEACFEDMEAPEWGRVEIQRFHADAHGVKLWRARQSIDAPTVGETSAYALVRFWVQSDEDPGSCVREASALKYNYEHHNWDETWQASTASAEYFGHEQYNFGAPQTEPPPPPWIDTLTIKDKKGAVIVDEAALVDDGCVTLPYDLNACTWRMRLDKPPPGWGEE